MGKLLEEVPFGQLLEGVASYRSKGPEASLLGLEVVGRIAPEEASCRVLKDSSIIAEHSSP